MNQQGGRKTGQQQASKLITKKPLSSPSSSRLGKQVSQPGESSGTKGPTKSLAGTKSSGTKNNNLKKKSSSGGSQQQRWKNQSSGGPKTTRMASERLTQQPQVVSMTAAQAQSTAQTLASLLLSRCMSSSSCSHLLDMCTTKQAMIPLESLIAPATEASSTTLSPNSESANWSMPVGLMSSSLMSLSQSLQADKVLRLFPQWKDQIENIVDQDIQTGYTLILPSNEAIDRLPVATVDSWLSNQDLLAQIIENHIPMSSGSNHHGRSDHYHHHGGSMSGSMHVQRRPYNQHGHNGSSNIGGGSAWRQDLKRHHHDSDYKERPTKRSYNQYHSGRPRDDYSSKYRD